MKKTLAAQAYLHYAVLLTLCSDTDVDGHANGQVDGYTTLIH